MLQSLTERVERLEAKAELFDKGLEVCVDAHKTTLKDMEGWKDSVQFFHKIIGAILIATGLRDKGDVMNKAFEQFDKGAEVRREILKPVQKDADLFSEPAEEDMWIYSKEACRALGWKSISTTMLRKAGIRYRQPLGKHRKITAHKGDIENYVRNRRNGRK